jgi:hypothetical protein
VLGAICGLFLGLFVAIDLMTFKVRPLDNFSVIGLPLIGLALGLLLGIAHPFRRSGVTETFQPAPAGPDEGSTVVSDEG